MKILHILDHSIPLHSGYTFRTLSILRQQRAMGWQTEHVTSAKHALAVKDTAADEYPSTSLIEEVDGLEFHRTPETLTKWRGSKMTGLLEPLAIINGLEKRLYEVVEEKQPDVLHAHSPALNGVAALRVGKRLGLPVVYECRAFWEDAAVNHGTCGQGSLRYRLTRAMESYVFRRANAITTICEGLRQDIVARGVEASKVIVIPNAVDIELFQNQEVTDTEVLRAGLLDRLPNSASVLLGFFGSFYDYEGLALMLDAMPRIIAEHPNACLLLVGGGPQESLIREKVLQMNLSSNVVLTGRVPHQQIKDYYQIVDVMVYPRLPMRLTELVTPLKPLEAMAKGKLVLASDVGGHRELIKDGETGYLFKAGCPQALADKVNQAISERQSWPYLQSQGRDYVVQDRNWERSVSFYRDAYGPLLQKSLL